MTDVPPPPGQPAPSPQGGGQPAWMPYAIGAAVIAVIALVAWSLRGPGGAPAEDEFTVEAFSPSAPVMTAREGVIGYEAPSTEARQAVMFGEGVALNVTGRVSRGLGNDWYALTWNDQTVFVRVADATAGDGAPPAPIVREEEPDEVDEDKPRPEDDPFSPLPDTDPPPQEMTPTGTLEISDVDWIREPNARDFARFFPDEALDSGQSGRVVLDCVIVGNGRLDCSVAQESPQGFGFGRAAMGISRQLRVQPTMPDGSSASGRHLRLPLNFRAG